MTLQRLVLVRHGETDFNATGRMQGHLDSHLTQTGLAQARAAVPAVTAFHPNVLLSSDLRRATDTAVMFAEATGLTLRIDKRLRETRLGEWQGLGLAEVEAGWPGDLNIWQNDPEWTPPGGEARVEVAARAAEVVAELDVECDGTAVLCAHGGLIASLTARLLSLPVANWPLLGGMSNCHWTVLARRPDGDGRWRLRAYNTGVIG